MFKNFYPKPNLICYNRLMERVDRVTKPLHLDVMQGNNEQRVCRINNTVSEQRKQMTQQYAKSPAVLPAMLANRLTLKGLGW